MQFSPAALMSEEEEKEKKNLNSETRTGEKRK